MPWATVGDFQQSETYRKVAEMHGWAKEKLQKFVSSFNEVFARAKRNGADDAKAEGLAFPIAWHVAKRAASAETVAKAEAGVHYFAAMAPTGIERTMPANGAAPTYSASNMKFSLVDKALPFLKSICSGLAVNWDHNHENQIGVIRDIVPRAAAPAEVQAVTDPAIPFLFVASYRNDIPAESRNEKGISAEWLNFGEEVLPLTFASSHSPLNGADLGIARVAAQLLIGEDAPTDLYDVDGDSHAAAVLKSEARNKLGASDFACPEDRGFPIHDLAHARNALSRLAQAHTSKCSVEAMKAKIYHKYPELNPAKKAAAEAPKVAAAKANGYQAKAASMQPGVSLMEPAELEAKVASLSTALDTESAGRKDAELKVAAFKTELDATKAKHDALVAEVGVLKAAATEKEANEAAISLVKEGKCAADKAPYFAGLFKEMGKEKFAALAAALPVSTVGVQDAKGAAAPAVDINDALKASLAAGARAAMLKGGA